MSYYSPINKRPRRRNPTFPLPLVKGGALVSEALATACAVRLGRASVYSPADLAQNRTSPGIELVKYHEEPQRTRRSPVTLITTTTSLLRSLRYYRRLSSYLRYYSPILYSTTLLNLLPFI